MKKQINNNNISEIADRLKEAVGYLKYQKIIRINKDISDAGVVGYTNLSAALNGSTTYLTSSFLDSFIEEYKIFNLDWILTGKGSMLKSDSANEPAPEYGNRVEMLNELLSLRNEQIEFLKERIKMKDEKIERLEVENKSLKKGNGAKADGEGVPVGS